MAMKEQLQALVSQLGEKRWLENTHYEQHIVKLIRGQLEAILAASPPAVSVKPGWVAKDAAGIWWHENLPYWTTSTECWNALSCHDYMWLTISVTDPWPDKLNGGPECCMEVKP